VRWGGCAVGSVRVENESGGGGLAGFAVGEDWGRCLKRLCDGEAGLGRRRQNQYMLAA